MTVPASRPLRSFRAPDPTPLRGRLKAFDRFVDKHDSSDVEIARMSRECEIDIAIDLMGPTEGPVLAILGTTAVPIQVMCTATQAEGRRHVGLGIGLLTLSSPGLSTIFSVEKVVYLPDKLQLGTLSQA